MVRIFRALLVVSVLFFSACASMSTKKYLPPDSIVGDYEVISYETTEAGQFDPTPMTGEANFGEDRKYSIRMRPNWRNAPADAPFLELRGLFYVMPDNKIKLYENDKENSEWVNNVTRYRVENWPDGKYLVLITELSKDDSDYGLSLLRGRFDGEARMLRDKYLGGFDWRFKKK